MPRRSGKLSPRIVGNTAWEYVYQPRGWRRLWQRPVIRFIYGFTYFYTGDDREESITVPAMEEFDAFTMPWVVKLASFGALDYVMKRIVWVSGVHDVCCRYNLFTKEKRADVFRESIWYAVQLIKADLKTEETTGLQQWAMKRWRIILLWLRNVMLIAGVKSASALGLAC